MGKKCPFLHTVTLFVKIVIIKSSYESRVFNETIGDSFPEHAHVSLKKIIKKARSSNRSVLAAFLKLLV